MTAAHKILLNRIGDAFKNDPNQQQRVYQMAQQRITEEHLWMPVMNVAMYTTSLKKLKGVRPHMLYQNTFYKGLDYSY